ncbi:hypothetical protein B484DRAFT_407757 [Ochromonadaceae sp. CCMP2298]|nr:hypothetical protein B484DRAFT_407757 [Ochromonadaceae sp. CCMP2298]
MEAVSLGAVVETQHIRQIGRHMGDSFMPLFSLLLQHSESFLCGRVVMGDAERVVGEIQNPICAFLAASQIHRWSVGELTPRERGQVTQNPPAQRFLAGPFSSSYLLRCLILKHIDLKAVRALGLCVRLPHSRSVEQEVPEVMKRQKLSRLYHLRLSLTRMIGDPSSYNAEHARLMGIGTCIDLLSM